MKRWLEHLKWKVPALSNSRHAVVPKSMFSPGSVARLVSGTTLCSEAITNLTMPCALIVVVSGVYASTLMQVVTVGTFPGGHVTVRTLGPAAASAIDAASGVV